MKRLLAGLLAACLAAPGAAAADEPRRRVIVASDVGAHIDDQWALAHLALEPRIELAGVLASHAPSLAYPAAKTAARHARETLAAVGRADVPVVAGLDGEFGFEQDIKPSAAADFLLGAAKSHTRERPLTVVLIGPATDVALALVVDPSLAERIEVVAMGFDGWPRGGDVWNVKNDVEAWRLLLHSRAPLVIGDGTVGKRDLALDRERARALTAGRGKAGELLGRLFERWLDGHADHARSVTGRADAWPLWDHVALAWLLGHARAEARPRPRLGYDMRFIHPAGNERAGPEVRWITAIDAAPLWQAFGAALERRAADERRP